jgi:hypothetical protein
MNDKCMGTIVPLIDDDAFLPLSNAEMAHPAGDRGGFVVSRA